MRFAGAEVWRASRTPDGPATVRFRPSGEDVEAEAWGEGAGWALEQAPELLGASDNAHDFRPPSGRLHSLHRALPGLVMVKSRRVVETLVPTILEQRVQGMEARRSYRRLTVALGAPAPGPGRLLLPPDPAELADLPYHRFHPFGIERRRAEVIRAVCRHRERLEEAVDLPPADSWKRLTAVPGVGPWTASYCRRLACGDPDSVIVGDLNLPGVVAWALAGERTSNDGRMLELLRPYHGHRGRAMLLIEASGMRPPRRAARSRSFHIEHI